MKTYHLFDLRIYTILFVILFLPKSSICTEGEDKNKSVTFIQPEFLIGSAIPSNSNFPTTSSQTVYSLSIGKIIHDPQKLWAVYLNYPSAGLSVFYSDYGNKDVFGSSITAMPYIALNTSKRHFNSLHFKIGIGATYFSTSYNKNSNPRNLAIGSRLTWVFQTTAYYNLLVSKHIDLNLGISFIHNSNGHTQMPNLGLNSLLFSFSSRIYLDPIYANNKDKYQKPNLKHTKQYFAIARLGIGMHEFGGPDSETGSVKRAVNIISFGVGTVFKQVVKLRVGFSYRFYQQYYNYIINYEPDKYKDNPVYYSSNFQVYIGGELLLGHIGIDAELGINILKPFYAYHHELHEDDNEVKYWLKQILSPRLGLKLYLNNTANNPKNNLYVGAYINANYGQADFSEITLGFVHRFSLRNE